MPAEIEAAAEVLYGPEWAQTLDPRGKDEARALAKRVLEAAEAHRNRPATGWELDCEDVRPGAVLYDRWIFV